MDIREYMQERAREEARREVRREAQKERWQKGQQDGMQKGMQQGMQKVALSMLREKADMSFICKVTNLSEKEIKKLKKRFLSFVR